MSKRREKKAPVKQGAVETARPDRASTVTFSIRLTSSERALLADAAKFKGWTTTTLIKQAAVERAAHIINIATPRNFEFEALARRLAEHLCHPKMMVSDGDNPEYPPSTLEQFFDVWSPGWENRFSVSCDSIVQLSLLRDAGRYGGIEFVARVLDECDRLSAKGAALPAPIDPSKLA